MAQPRPDISTLNPKVSQPTTSVEDQLSSPGKVSIIDLVDALIKKAHALRASDIHIDPIDKFDAQE